MIRKNLSLLLAVLLLFSLAACSSGEPPQTPDDGTDLSGAPDGGQTPDENQPLSPAEGQTPDKQPEQSPDDSAPSDPAPDEAPEQQPGNPGNAKPDSSKPKPSAPGDSPDASESDRPSSEPPQSQPDDEKSFSISDIWSDIKTSLGDSLPDLDALDADTLTALYPLSTADLAEYGYYGSLIGVQASEFFIAKVQSGKMETVKTAILSRQADLDAQWRQYLPEQYELVKNYKLVQNGDYVFFGVAEKVSDAVDIFNQYTK